ncbi:hypothetical protein [Ascidiaceihabitans sp.]|uniref:hypothetical protein n=1 Tax=Ascidiaceihabitans sp. TaxID=1872644 RepID=UPI0032989CE7
MNALPLDNSHTPREVIDDLIASFGFRRVFFAVLTRVFKRSRPPDAIGFGRLCAQTSTDHLCDHLRRDIGLPPNTKHKLEIDLFAINLESYR